MCNDIIIIISIISNDINVMCGNVCVVILICIIINEEKHIYN